MSDMEFPGEENVIYAGWLRDMGCEVPEHVPDCAWVPRWSMTMGSPSFKQDDNEPDVVRMDMDMNFSEPWRWVSVDIVIPAENPLKGPAKKDA